MINRTIEAKTEKILRDFNITAAPIPIEEISNKLGIKISYAPSTEYSGMLVRKENGALMGINSEEKPERRRFSVAHELGHFCLEKKEVSVDYRNNQHQPNKPPAEKHADDFAANLLMPRTMLKKDFYKISAGKAFSDDLPAQLAKLYQVSREAMAWRLKNLNLIG